jgi:hypothetical protein
MLQKNSPDKVSGNELFMYHSSIDWWSYCLNSVCSTYEHL